MLQRLFRILSLCLFSVALVTVLGGGTCRYCSGTSCDDDQSAFSQSLALSRGSRKIFQSTTQLAHCGVDSLGWHRSAVLLRKIYLVRDECLEVQHLISQLLNPRRETPVKLAKCSPPLRRCRRFDQVADRLGLEQVQFPVQNGAPGKLTRRSKTCSRGKQRG